ncbi:hypothetical protein PR048_012965 [Dryococelus australis]|uniref:Uncharacterized protein n=1 Tax=Dryococelus australis TaxID=614101 RepID=A0ABQ9HQU5_9NEOP|nr:hypothetical protein PR048_012965 [Dryococelus australis]
MSRRPLHHHPIRETENGDLVCGRLHIMDYAIETLSTILTELEQKVIQTKHISDEDRCIQTMCESGVYDTWHIIDGIIINCTPGEDSFWLTHTPREVCMMVPT